MFIEKVTLKIIVAESVANLAQTDAKSHLKNGIDTFREFDFLFRIR